MLKIEVENRLKGPEVVEICTNINMAFTTRDSDPGTKPLVGDETNQTKNGAILNFPLPEDLDTLHLGRVNSTGTNCDSPGLRSGDAGMYS